MATRIVRGFNKGSGNLEASASVRDVPETPDKSNRYGFKIDPGYFGVNDPKNIKAAERFNTLDGAGVTVVRCHQKFAR